MPYIVGLAGLAQVAFGLLYLGASRSAVHEAVAAMLFGMGVLAVALAAILHRLNNPVAMAEPSQSQAAKGDLITIYKMYDIRREGLAVKAGGQTFPDVDAAKAYIDKLA